MSKFWRVIAPVVAAGGLVAAGAIPAASASPATYGISIGAKSSVPKISGHTLVVYKYSGYTTASISGSVSGAIPGDVATLWSKPFGAKTFTATSSTATVATDPQTYSFSVTPSQATAYEVQVTTGTTVDATSSAVTVYVTEGAKSVSFRGHCSAGHCTTSWKVYIKLPAAAYKTEAGKKWYLYMALSKNVPHYLNLTKNASASKARKVNSGEYDVTLTFHFSASTYKTFWGLGCVKDSESKDGMGLPGRHGCGAKRISTKSNYIG
jgi:hypothetical protein